LKKDAIALMLPPNPLAAAVSLRGGFMEISLFFENLLIINIATPARLRSTPSPEQVIEMAHTSASGTCAGFFF